MINRYYDYQPMQRADYSAKMPMDLMIKTAATLQDQSDKNYAALQEAPGLLKVNVHNEDIQNRFKVEQEYRNMIDEIVKKYDGNFAHANKDVIALKSKLRNDLAPSGRLGAMSTNYATYNDYKKSIMDSKDLTNDEKSALIQNADLAFKAKGGTGFVDPRTGQYNPYSGKQMTGYNVQERLDKMPEFKASSTETIESGPDGMFVVDLKTGKKEVLADRVYKTALAHLDGDPRYKEWRRTRAEIGRPVSDDEIHQAIMAQVGIRAFSDETKDLKRTVNPMFEYAQRERHWSEKKALLQQASPDPTVISIGADQQTYQDPQYKKDAPSFWEKLSSFSTAGVGASGPTEVGPDGKIQYKDLTKGPKDQVDGRYQPLTYDNQWIKEDPIRQAVLTKSAQQIFGKKWDLANQADKNKMLADYQSKPEGAKTLRAQMDETGKQMHQAKTNAELNTITYGEETRKNTTQKILAERGSVQMTDLSGKAQGSLSKTLTDLGANEKAKKGEKGYYEVQTVGEFMGSRDRIGSKTTYIYIDDGSGNMVPHIMLAKNVNLGYEKNAKAEMDRLYSDPVTGMPMTPHDYDEKKNPNASGSVDISYYDSNGRLRNLPAGALLKGEKVDKLLINSYQDIPNPKAGIPMMIQGGRYVTFDPKNYNKNGMLYGTVHESDEFGNKISKPIILEDKQRAYNKISKLTTAFNPNFSKENLKHYNENLLNGN